MYTAPLTFSLPLIVLFPAFQQEVAELKQSLSRERSESERLSADVASEKLHSRQLEREVERLQQSLEDYRFSTGSSYTHVHVQCTYSVCFHTIYSISRLCNATM